ncbi:MAG: DUF2726 domain-containing protein, partial [Burkholderiales bacterium]
MAIAVLVAAALAAIIMKRSVFRGGNEPWPFYAKKVLTQPEQVLYHRLVAAMPEHIVLAQVQLSRVLGVKKGFHFNEWNNRINRMSLDFLICSKDSSAIFGVELDDKTHSRPSRAEADSRKEKAMRGGPKPAVARFRGREQQFTTSKDAYLW